MPIYEFVCEACGRLAEVMQKLSDPAPACPECGERRMARTVSRTSFQLKGGGWYADLYASAKKDAPAAGEKPAAGGGEAPKEKPAAAPAPTSPPAGGGAAKDGGS